MTDIRTNAIAELEASWMTIGSTSVPSPSYSPFVIVILPSLEQVYFLKSFSTSTLSSLQPGDPINNMVYNMAVPVSLRPMARDATPQRDITGLVDQIYKERKRMRLISSEALRSEIEVDEATIIDQDSDDESGKEESTLDADNKLKSLFEAKEEMMTFVGYARALNSVVRKVDVHVANQSSEANNEVLMLQDFVSLLLSKDSPNAAKSMSPALKELVPANTFAFDRLSAVQPKADDLKRAQSQADGIGFQTLNATADRLLNSATRLEQEMTKETQYWDQILSVAQQGWNVTKIRGSAHSLGVRYACSEGTTFLPGPASNTYQVTQQHRNFSPEAWHHCDQTTMVTSSLTLEHLMQQSAFRSVSCQPVKLSQHRVFHQCWSGRAVH